MCVADFDVFVWCDELLLNKSRFVDTDEEAFFAKKKIEKYDCFVFCVDGGVSKKTCCDSLVVVVLVTKDPHQKQSSNHQQKIRKNWC